MKKLFVLLLIFAISFASLSSCTQDVLSIVTKEQGELLGIVIGLTTIAIVLIYLFGKFTEKAEYIVLAKDEAYHLLLSAILLVSFGGIITTGCLISDSLTQFTISTMNVNVPCLSNVPSATAACNLQYLEAKVDNMIYTLTHYQLQYLQDSGWAYSAGDILGGETKTTMMEAYKKVYANEMDILLSNYIFPVRLSISMQKTAIKIIDESIIQWILPIAFLFRFFPPFRSAGNILLGICLALYIVLPLFMIFNFLMYYSVAGDCNSYRELFKDKPLDSEIGLPTCGSPISLWDISALIPLAFFLPNLAIALTITFIAAVDKALRVIG